MNQCQGPLLELLCHIGMGRMSLAKVDAQQCYLLLLLLKPV
jgi:hypothetical protein